MLRLPTLALALDVDGTIADTDPVHARAWHRAYRDVTGGNGFTVSDYLEQCVSGAMSPRQFLSRFIADEEWPRVQDVKRSLYPSLLAEGTRLAAGLSELVADAHRNGVKIAVVSSSSRESVGALLAFAWPAPAPDVLVCRGDAGEPKPSASPYVRALELLGVPAAETVAFEDADAGVRSAKSAGLTCVRVGRHDVGEADVRIADFRQCDITEQDGTVWLTIRIS